MVAQTMLVYVCVCMCARAQQLKIRQKAIEVRTESLFDDTSEKWYRLSTEIII